MLKIDFPVGYKVRYSENLDQYVVAVPPVYVTHTVNTVKAQDWVVTVYRDNHGGNIYVLVNEAYIATPDEIIAALEALCKHVMGRKDVPDGNSTAAN